MIDPDPAEPPSRPSSKSGFVAGRQLWCAPPCPTVTARAPSTRRRASAAIALLTILAWLARPDVAAADPQLGAALTLGGGVTGLERGGHTVGVFHLGGRADALFLRQRSRDMAVGPYVEIASEAFSSLELGGGAEWLVPVEPFALVLSVGGHGRHTAETGWNPGITSTVFLGSHDYNFHSVYALTAGLFAQARYGLGPDHATQIVAGLSLDLSFLAYPFLFLYGAVRR